MLKLHFVLVILLSSAISFAAGPFLRSGTEVGNGGFGVMVNGKLYLQDLVEAGIYEDPFFIIQYPVPSYFQEAAHTALEGTKISTRVLDLVANKLYELEFFDRSFTYSLALALTAYSWRIVDVPLQDPEDSDGVIDEDQVEYRLLAVRSGKVVRIQKQNWDLLNEYNQAALIFHEVIYSLLTPQIGESKAQRSQKARDLTGYIFSPDLPNRGLVGLASAIGKTWYFGQGQMASYQGSSFLDHFQLEYTVNPSLGSSQPFSRSEIWNFGHSLELRTRNLCNSLNELQELRIFNLKFSRQRRVVSFDVHFPTSPDDSAMMESLLMVDSKPENFEIKVEARPDLRQCQADITPAVIQGMKFMGVP